MSAVKGTSFQLPPPQASLFFFLLGAVKLSLSLSSLFGGRVHRVIWEKAVLCQCALNELVEERVFFVFPSRFLALPSNNDFLRRSVQQKGYTCTRLSGLTYSRLAWAMC